MATVAVPAPTAVARPLIRSGQTGWRFLIWWLLLYLPFSGLLPLAMYPVTGPGVLVKDLFFIGPAYVLAIIAVVTRRERLTLPGAPVFLAASLTLLILVCSLNPVVYSPLLAMIGMKVWLYTPPLMILGYHFFRELDDLRRLLKLMAMVAMIPCAIGIFEAMLIAAGGLETVYSFYGDAAAATTQDQAAFQFGDGTFARIPSIFTFVSQYWLYSTATIALVYAAWRGNRADPFMRWFGPLAMAVAFVASLTAGARAAWAFSPILLLLIAVLEGVRLRTLVTYASGAALTLGLTLLAIGIDAGALIESLSNHTVFILEFFGDGVQYAVDHGLTGLGTGVDTGAARYAFPSDDYGVVYGVLGGVWWESWYLKALLELGIAGLVLLVLLLGALLKRSVENHRKLTDPELRSMSAAFLGLFIWIVVYCVKTAYIDFDPMTIYIWLFLGVQWSLVRFQASAQGSR